MGNYRQHLGFAASFGAVYASVAYVLGGVHWAYGTVAALLTTVSGLLPDLDSASGVEVRGLTGMLGLLTALGVWRKLARAQPSPSFEYHLLAMVGTYIFVRHALRRILTRISVHRGISHSLPFCAVWGGLVYLHYPSNDHFVRLMMASAVMLGFFSHLLLDEMCSVDLQGARVNRAFGTALKLWAPSAWSTLATYGLLAYLSWQIINVWPEDGLAYQPPEPPVFPVSVMRRIPFPDAVRKHIPEEFLVPSDRTVPPEEAQRDTPLRDDVRPASHVEPEVPPPVEPLPAPRRRWPRRAPFPRPSAAED